MCSVWMQYNSSWLMKKNPALRRVNELVQHSARPGVSAHASLWLWPHPPVSRWKHRPLMRPMLYIQESHVWGTVHSFPSYNEVQAHGGGQTINKDLDHHRVKCQTSEACALHESSKQEARCEAV